MNDRILLHGMVFFGFHGVHPEEKKLGQRFIVDVDLNVSLQDAGMTDDLTRTVHYGHVYKLIKEIVTGPSCNLIEAVAERIASAVLKQYSAVEGINVRIRKPEVPIEGVLDFAGVEIERNRK